MATQAQIEEAQQEARDAKNAPKIDKAYDKSLRSTELAENKTNFGGKTGIEGAAMEKAATDDYKKFGSVQGPADDQRSQSAIQAASRAARNEIKRETKGMAPKAYSKGGSVSSASRRADGIATKGKTRGKMY